MATTLESTDFGVRLGKREFPKRTRAQRKSIRPPASEVIDLTTAKSVTSQLEQRVMERVMQNSSGFDDRDRAVQFANYTECINELRRYREQSLTLFRAIAETVFTYDLPDDEQSVAFVESIVNESQVKFPAPVSGASAELGALPVEEIGDELRVMLIKAVTDFVKHLFSALDALVDRSLAGLAHWTGQNSVRYHFFRRYARVTGETRQRTGNSEMQEHLFLDAKGGLSRWKLIHEVEVQRELTCTLFHHKHDTVNAIATNLDNAQVPMPHFVVALCKAIPEWMRPDIQVIDGYLIREQIFQRDLKSFHVSQMQYEEELIYGCEPAVCLGPYVLTGWGPRDISAMQKIESMQTRHAATAQSRTFWLTWSLLAQGLTTLLLSTSSGWLPLALLLFPISIGCLAVGLRQQLRLTEVSRSELQLQLLLSGPALLFAGWQLLWSPAGFWVGLFGATLIVLGGAIIKSTRLFTYFSHPTQFHSPSKSDSPFSQESE